MSLYYWPLFLVVFMLVYLIYAEREKKGSRLFFLKITFANLFYYFIYFYYYL